MNGEYNNGKFSFLELNLPDDDPVYTLKKVMEDIDYSGLLAQYSNKGRNGFNPIMMYATVVYAAMRGIRSVRTLSGGNLGVFLCLLLGIVLSVKVYYD